MSEKAAVWEDINVLVPWSDNPRHNQSAIQSVADSIRRFGFASPIIAREADKMIIAGHTRLEAAKSLGLDRVPVRYLDLDPADAKMLALADNKIGEIADWDEAALEKIIDDLSLSADDMADLGWSTSELDDLFESDFDAVDEGSVHVDEDSEPVSKIGEVYDLGDHRLLCGDSTKEESWQELMGEEKANLCITDPPYGIGYEGGSKVRDVIKNDEQSISELESFLDKVFKNVLYSIKAGSSVYVFSPAGDRMTAFCNALCANNLFKHSLVWYKNNSTFGRCDYHYRHEVLFYGWKEGAAHYFIDDRTQDTVMCFDRPSVSKDHPTMKPIDILCKIINNSSKRDWVVIDAFGGSGTTLIACAETGRRARLIELDPRYCDVIRRRWFKYATEHNLDVGDGLDG